MATSVLMANDHNTTNPSLQPLPDQNHDHLSIRRSSGGRRKPKAPTGCEPSGGQKKKQPQRGMGVEKLERLRLQERWKKMTEINPSNNQTPYTVPITVVSASFAEPTLINASAPFHQTFSKLDGFIGAPNVSVGLMGLNPGFQGQMGGGLVSEQFQGDLFGFGGSNSGKLGVVKSLAEISKELSSSPSALRFHSHQHCPACHKKKKVVNGENMGCSGVNMKISSSVDHSGFLGFHVPESQNLKNRENEGFGRKEPLLSQMGYSAVRPGVEVVAVHRKGYLSSGDQGAHDHVLMEYEFFPSAAGRKDSDRNDELVMMKNSLLGRRVSEGEGPSGQQQTCCGTGPGFDHASSSSTNSIDLSLKLSY